MLLKIDIIAVKSHYVQSSGSCLIEAILHQRAHMDVLLAEVASLCLSFLLSCFSWERGTCRARFHLTHHCSIALLLLPLAISAPAGAAGGSFELPD